MLGSTVSFPKYYLILLSLEKESLGIFHVIIKHGKILENFSFLMYICYLFFHFPKFAPHLSITILYYNQLFKYTARFGQSIEAHLVLIRIRITLARSSGLLVKTSRYGKAGQGIGQFW